VRTSGFESGAAILLDHAAGGRLADVSHGFSGMIKIANTADTG